jgi:hypothetical protein
MVEDADYQARHRLRLPGFLVREPVGLGQVVKRVTTAAGVRPCSGCQRRADRLDDWLRIEPAADRAQRGERS